MAVDRFSFNLFGFRCKRKPAVESVRGFVKCRNTKHSRGQGNEGSQVNAFRHVLWQATITKNYGTEIATEVGKAHEENPEAIEGKSPQALSNTVFKTLSAADESIDLSNNIIGREIGKESNGLGMKDIALKALDEFKSNGLWTATKQDDGSWKMTKTKITSAQYNVLKGVFQTSDNNGFTPAEQTKRFQDAMKEQRTTIQD